MKRTPTGTLLTNRPQKPLNKFYFVSSLCVSLTCAVTLLVLALRGVSVEDFGYFPHLLVLLAVAIFLIASLAITDIIPWHSENLRDWSRPKVLGSFIALIMGSLGLAAGLTPIFNSPAATAKSLADVSKRLEEAGITRGDDSQIEKYIYGSWGEPGCHVTYHIALDKGLLTVVSRKSVDGQVPLKIELQAERGGANRMVASVIDPLKERGEQHEFLYEQAGTHEFLTWIIKRREISLRLDRCP